MRGDWRFCSEEVVRLQQIARAPDGAPGFRERVEQLAQALSVLVPSTSLAAYVLDMHKQEAPTCEHLVFLNGDPAGLITYLQHYIWIDPMGAAFREGKGKPYLLSDFVRGKGLQKNEFTARFMPSFGIRHIMALTRWMPDGRMFALAVHRNRDLRDFTERQREAMRLASPDIARAIEQVLVRERVSELSRLHGDQHRSGAIVFDAVGEIAHADQGGLRLARQLGNDADFPTEHFLPEVRRMLSARPPVPPSQGTHVLHNGEVLRIRYSLMGAGRHRSVIAILELLNTASSDHFDALTARFRLTAREKEVARLAARGLGNRQIGAALQISPITVGIHLGHIYRKTGTHGRHDLAALLNGSPPGDPPRTSADRSGPRPSTDSP